MVVVVVVVVEEVDIFLRIGQKSATLPLARPVPPRELPATTFEPDNSTFNNLHCLLLVASRPGRPRSEYLLAVLYVIGLPCKEKATNNCLSSRLIDNAQSCPSPFHVIRAYPGHRSHRRPLLIGLQVYHSIYKKKERKNSCSIDSILNLLHHNAAARERASPG